MLGRLNHLESYLSLDIIAILFSFVFMLFVLISCNGGGSGGDGDSNTLKYYRDADGDGYGDTHVSIEAESQPSGYVLVNTDCDDTDPNINPGATEICNDLNDNECDGNMDYCDSDCSGYPSYTGNVLFYEPGEGLQTNDMNGEVFDAGFSFSGWFYFTYMSNESKDVIGISNQAFYIDRDNIDSFNLHLNDTSANTGSLAIKEWHNLALTYDLSTVNYYLDGALIGSAEASGPVEFGNNWQIFFYIGDFYGSAQQIKIWNRGLSAEELIWEINRADSSSSDGIKHQWQFNESKGTRAVDSVGDADFEVRRPYWVDLDGAYEIVHQSMLRITDENKLLPNFTVSYGSVDLNQDGFPDLFYHGTSDFIQPKAPLLALQNDGTGYFIDASDSLIDGGLYFRRLPSGRETIIADLNNDGFEDIFIGQFGVTDAVLEPEANCLLLSNGNLGKLYPSESTIMSPPCTLIEPEFIGQKPCSSDSQGNIYYPDNSAPLVPIDIRSYDLSSTSGDIDNDGDIDIFVAAWNTEESPVSPHFLINDGNGNFTANWQMVPNKAFYDIASMDGIPDERYTMVKLEDIDGDGFLDLVMFGGSPELPEHIPSDPFDVEQDYWYASVHDLIAWGTDGGFSEIYTILEKDSLFTILLRTILTSDIDMDGDLDIIATKQIAISEKGYYLQVFSNNGNRTFTDVTQQSIPQDPDIVSNLLLLWNGEMRNIDFNGDQCPDFFQQSIWLYDSDYDQPFTMWLNNCKGYFTPIERRFVGKMGLLIPLDADGDGDVDFVSQKQGQDSNGYNYLEHTLLRRTKSINMDKYIDTDRDGINDIHDTDDDGDGVNDSEDAFPKDQYES